MPLKLAFSARIPQPKLGSGLQNVAIAFQTLKIFNMKHECNIITKLFTYYFNLYTI